MCCAYKPFLLSTFIRLISFSVERHLVDRVVPGTRVSVMAVSALMNKGVKLKLGGNTSIRTPYLKVVGIQIDANGGGRMNTTFTSDEVNIENVMLYYVMYMCFFSLLPSFEIFLFF